MSSTLLSLTSPVEEARTVLVVDDEELNRHLYAGLLARAGYRVECAPDGESAVASLDRVRPDLVLLDFRMPGLDGPGVIRRLREAPRHAETPVLLLTASGEADHVARAFDAGADDYLLKPVNPRILIARVEATLAAREAVVRARELEQRERSERALRDRLLSDLDEARAVQRAQVPSFPVRRGAAWVSGCVLPSGHVGGDVLDVFDLPNGATAAIVVDVAGHGTAAALVASAIRSDLRHLLASRPVDEALAELGRSLMADGGRRYACVALVVMHGADYAIVNAGLPPVWVGTARAARVLVDSSGAPPGLFESPSGYRVERGTLGPGEIIAIVSDGLTEPFGFADEIGGVIPRLLRGRLSGAVPSAEHLSEIIQTQFHAIGQVAQPDDASLLVVGRAD